MKNSFFDINSVVIIWASENSWKIWNDLLKNLKDFKGEKFWVNPKWWSFKNIKFYKKISDLPIIPDIAVIAIPAKFVINSLEEIAKKQIKKVIIISAWFKEIWNISEEEKIIEIAKKNNIKILWPNCLWYIDTHKKLNLSFWTKNIKSWNIAMISQSWAMAVAFTDWAYEYDLGFSKIISMWNKADIWENELLLELEKDEKTKVIVMYLESIEDGRKFYEIAKRITKIKPIILVKSAISKRWMKAASSHTGALAWSAKVFKTAFKQSWIIYTGKLEDFFLWWKTFSEIQKIQTIPEELAIITNAGWPWVMITDHAENLWIKLTTFDENETKILKYKIPEASSVKNPIDIIWDATSQRYLQILKNLNSLKKKRAILIMLTPQTVTDTENIAKIIIDFKKENPNLFIMTSFMWWISLKKAKKILKNKEILDFDYPQKAALAYSQVLRYKKLLKTNFNSNIDIKLENKKEILEIKKQLSKQKKLASNSLTSKIFEYFKIDYLNEFLVKSKTEAKNIFKKLWNNTLIAKISSPDIAHKTDVGWIYFNINSSLEAQKAYETIINNVKKNAWNVEISWVIFSRQLDNSWKNKEIFVWLKRDEIFWEILIVWMWWIFVNIYEDISMRLAPICKNEIKTMIEQLKWYKILSWYRWEKSINFDKLIENIFNLQVIFHNFPEIKEIDINPIFANNKESIIVDAKMYL